MEDEAGSRRVPEAGRVLPVAGEVPIVPAIPAAVHRAGGSAEAVSQLARRSGRTVAVAESLTGGQLAAALAEAAGAAEWFHGGVVAYSRTVKHGLLEVPDGPVVSPAAAQAMAATAARLTGADVAVAVTGVGGPDEQDGEPVGTVWFGICDQGDVRAEKARYDGAPDEVLVAARQHALELLAAAVAR